jgi:hypothetical protein
MSAKSRYDRLSSDRSQFINTARQASDLTLPYLIREDEVYTKGSRKLITPWQSVGAKGVVTLASKLMLALLPPQTSFFKLQVNDINLGEELGPEIRSELDLSFAKVERTIMESIAASGDRVVVHQALKHLVVAGNALVFMGKDGLKLYPLNRYVVDRDGNGNVIEIVTKETISKKLLKKFYPDYKTEQPNSPSDNASRQDDECDIYTHVVLDNNRWVWHQEVEDQILPKSMSKAPVDANPWLVLRFNHVDGEVYGRGRVEEFIGDLKSLEALSQAIIEGSAAAAKVVFTVSPSSTTKPATLAKAGNGAIIQGRPDDIGVVQVGKTADFQTAYQMIGSLTQRLNEAFLVLNVRDSERTTAEEVRMTQLELEQQLGGLFSLLTVEFLVPYLNRKLSVAQKTGEIPRLPKGDIVRPTIVAGINALGRGQDRESLGQFITVIAQTMGPEAIQQYINPDEVIKRLAAASGIDVLNLVKSMDERQAEQQQAMAQQQQMMAMQQEPQMAAVEQKREQAAMQQMQQQQLPPELPPVE